MGNAVEAVKQAADYETADNEHDGVARVVERVFLAERINRKKSADVPELARPLVILCVFLEGKQALKTPSCRFGTRVRAYRRANARDGKVSGTEHKVNVCQ